jgi:uncharacterized membrane protein YhhN
MMPFPGGIESTANGTLILSAAAALLYLGMVEREANLRRTAAKTLAVALLALLAVLEYGSPLLAAALALSAIGDAFLSRDGEQTFLAGLACFLVAHLVYVALFALSGQGFGIIAQEFWRPPAGALMTAATAFLLFRLRMSVDGPMRNAVTAYAAAILAMGLSALTVPGPWVALGAALFMASDALLGTERFLLAGNGETRRTLRHVIWVLYYTAQLMIVLAGLLPLSA